MLAATSSSLLVIIEIIGPIVLAAALIYATIKWSRRRRAKVEVSEAATRSLYREAARQERMEEATAARGSASTTQGADELPSSAKLRGVVRSGREEGRWTEDDIAREHLSVTGRGDASKPKVLDERETQLNRQLDPGHTA
jgi:hypothetical protein